MAARDKALAKLLSSFGDSRFEELKEELLYVEDFEDEADGPVTGLETESARETTIGEAPAANSVMPPMAEQLTVPLEKIIPEVSAMQAVEATYEQVPKVMPEPIVQPVVQIHPVSQSEASPVVNEMPPVQPVIDPEALAREEARLQAKEEARKLLTQPVVQISAEQRKTVSQINRESREKRVIHPIDAQKRYNSKRAVSKDTDERTDPVSDKSDVAVKSSLKKILDESDPHK